MLLVGPWCAVTEENWMRGDWERVAVFCDAFIEADSYCHTGLFKEGVEAVVRIV